MWQKVYMERCAFLVSSGYDGSADEILVVAAVARWGTSTLTTVFAHRVAAYDRKSDELM